MSDLDRAILDRLARINPQIARAWRKQRAEWRQRRFALSYLGIAEDHPQAGAAVEEMRRECERVLSRSAAASRD